VTGSYTATDLNGISETRQDPSLCLEERQYNNFEVYDYLSKNENADE